MFIKEIGYTKHINERIYDRVFSIKDITIQEDFFEIGENKDLIKGFIKQKIENEVKERLMKLRDEDFDITKSVVYKLLKINLERNNKKYKINLTTETEDQYGVLKTYYGDLYIVLIVENFGITIMNVDSNLSDSILEKKIRRFGNEGYKTEVLSYSPLEFTVKHSITAKKTIDIINKVKKTKLGETSLKKYNELMFFEINKEKSISILDKKKKEIEDFLKSNIERLNSSEIKNLENKKDIITKRIEIIQSSSEKAIERLQKKSDYRKGAKFQHYKFGKGTIQKVEKNSDGIYDITIDFPGEGIKKIRAAVKQKPAETSAGLSESVTRIIRKLIRQQQGL